MKTRQWVVTMLAAAVMGGCVVPDHPRPVVVEHHHGNPYLVGDGIDMGAPVYFSAYPDHAFYHRYDRHCDCIRIVRLVSSGGAVFWVDQFGKRVHEGHWEPARPSAHALHSYRGWSRQHYSELHRAPPPGHRMAPPPPAPPPAPVPHIGGHRDHRPGPVVRPPPPVAPVPVVKPSKHGKGDRPAKPGQFEHPAKPAKPGQFERPIKPAKPGQADQPVKPAPVVQPVKPEPAIQPGKTVPPAPVAQPVKPEPAIQPGKTVPPAPVAQPVKPVPAVPPGAEKAVPVKGDVPATPAAKEAPK